MAINNRFSLNAFISEVNKGNTLSPNRYLVFFSPFKSFDSFLQTNLSNVNQKLVLRCDNANLPSMALLNGDVRRYGYGPIEKSPHSIQFTNLNLTWILDKNGKIVKFFKNWFEKIINHSSKGGADMQTKKRGASPYEMSYKDDFVCPELDILVYDTENNAVLKYRMYDVYPSLIEEVPLNWDNKNTMIRLTVQFFYTDLEIETVDDSESYINIFENIPKDKKTNQFIKIFKDDANRLSSKAGRKIENEITRNITTII